jgi:Ca2+-binding RTX toxin-like protein
MARIIGTNDDDVLRGERLDAARRLSKYDDDDPDSPWTGNSDLLDGRAGNDSLYGESGPDRLIGGSGRDHMEGGSGSDTILPAGGSFLIRPEGNVVDGGDGRDWVSYEDEVFESVILSMDGGLSYDTLISIENLRGGGGGDRLTGDAGRNIIEGLGGRDTLFGGDGADSLVGGDEAVLGDDLSGGSGADTLDGGNGFDYLDGGTGADLLLGGQGTDLLQGGGGNDTLQGGLGADSLSGGGGSDVFLFAAAAEGGDLILDYAWRRDQVHVSAAGFGGGLVAGTDIVAAGQYVENADGMTTAEAGVGQFIYNTTTGRLSWDADGAGGAAAVFIVDLSGALGWTGAEITII